MQSLWRILITIETSWVFLFCMLLLRRYHTADSQLVKRLGMVYAAIYTARKKYVWFVITIDSFLNI